MTSTTNVQVEISFSHLETVTRARMTMKTKYVKMFVRKKALNIQGEKVSSLVENPIKCLRKCFVESPTDSNQS